MSTSPERDAAPTSDAPPAPSLGRRMLLAAGLLAVVVVVPTVLALLLAGATAAAGAALGSILAFFLCLLTGWKRAAVFVVPLLAAAGLSATLAGSPWWVVGLVAIGLLAGLLATRGMLTPFAFIGVAWSVAQPTDPPGDLVLLLLFALLGAGYAIALARRKGLPSETPMPQFPMQQAVLLAIGLAAAGGIAGAITLNWDADNAYWLPMTVFVLALPEAGSHLSERAFARVVGTAAGVGAALVLSSLFPAALASYLLAFVGLTLTVAVPTPRWFNAATTAFAIVMALTPTAGLDVGESRLSATLLGAVIVVVIAGILALVARFIPASVSERAVVEDYESALRSDADPA